MRCPHLVRKVPKGRLSMKAIAFIGASLEKIMRRDHSEAEDGEAFGKLSSPQASSRCALLEYSATGAESFSPARSFFHLGCSHRFETVTCSTTPRENGAAVYASSGSTALTDEDLTYSRGATPMCLVRSTSMLRSGGFWRFWESLPRVCCGETGNLNCCLWYFVLAGPWPVCWLVSMFRFQTSTDSEAPCKCRVRSGRTVLQIGT
jgi:hypothetical protein